MKHVEAHSRVGEPFVIPFGWKSCIGGSSQDEVGHKCHLDRRHWQVAHESNEAPVTIQLNQGESLTVLFISSRDCPLYKVSNSHFPPPSSRSPASTILLTVLSLRDGSTKLISSALEASSKNSPACFTAKNPSLHGRQELKIPNFNRHHGEYLYADYDAMRRWIVVSQIASGELMSNLFEDTPTKELSWLLRQIEEREIALPDFQRDFVWEPAATQELIVSIGSNYPAGSLLAIRNTHAYFAAREFEGAPALKSSKPTYLILDGQQRLTSLYQAFFGRGDYKYFVNLKKLIMGHEIDDEEVLFHVRSNAQRGWQAQVLKRYATLSGQADDLVMPLRVLFGEKDGFLGWCDDVVERVEDKDARKTLRHQLMELRKKVVSHIESYKFPVVLLSDQTPADAVCTIFETLNRTGVKLSVFDLLAARFWPENVKLRDMWDVALTRFPIIQDFAIDPYYILQIIALLRTEAAPSCKRKDVLALTASKVAELWEDVVGSLASALTILRDDCGVLIPKWLPYNTMVIPFGALLARHPATKGLKAGEVRHKLVRWFWCSVFNQSYENAPNSQAAKDFLEIGSWLAGRPSPANVESFTFEPTILHEVTPKQRALYRGVIALILSRHPRDFYAAKPMTRAVMEENNVDDHHIFPDAFLQKQGVKESKRRDCILNRTLIDRATNQSLSDRNPKDYFQEINGRLGDQKFGELLQSHLLPNGDDSPLSANDYHAFLEWRRERIAQLIKEATTES